jgi:hypothetical protein
LSLERHFLAWFLTGSAGAARKEEQTPHPFILCKSLRFRVRLNLPEKNLDTIVLEGPRI